MLAGGNYYPDRDPQTFLTLPAHRRPFPIVVDADELIRDVVTTVRNPRQTILRGLAEDRYARLLATEVVHDEVERHLAEVAQRDYAAAVVVWETQYRPLTSWVRIPPRTLTVPPDEREAELVGRLRTLHARHANDVPTGELALLCAPCFVVTGNRRHLHAAGFGRDDWLGDLSAAGELAMLESSGYITMVLAEMTTESSIKGIRAIRRLIGDSPFALGVAGFLVGGLLAHGVANRGRIPERLGRAMDALGQGAERLSAERAARLTRITDAVVPPLQDPPLAALLARTLARATAPMPMAELAAIAGQADNRDGLSSVRQCLRQHPAFVPTPGRGWDVGQRRG